MKTLLMICLFMMIAGCAPTVKGWEILAIQKICESHGGIDHINTTIYAVGVCRDGTFAETKRGGEI